MNNVGIHKWFPKERIFPEEHQTFSATLRAVRYALKLAKGSRETTGPDGTNSSVVTDEEPVYYLV